MMTVRDQKQKHGLFMTGFLVYSNVRSLKCCLVNWAFGLYQSDFLFDVLTIDLLGKLCGLDCVATFSAAVTIRQYLLNFTGVCDAKIVVMLDTFGVHKQLAMNTWTNTFITTV